MIINWQGDIYAYAGLGAPVTVSGGVVGGASPASFVVHRYEIDGPALAYTLKGSVLRYEIDGPANICEPQ